MVTESQWYHQVILTDVIIDNQILHMKFQILFRYNFKRIIISVRNDAQKEKRGLIVL